MGFTIRPAVPADAATITTLIGELAEYERLSHEARATPESIHAHLFGARRFAESLIAEADGAVAGFALFFHNYSTFRAQPGIYLEDLFVRPAFRGRGIGKALLQRLAAVALERGCGRLEWAVLDWNQSAIDFYRNLGARPMDEWTIYRVDEEALAKLAAPA